MPKQPPPLIALLSLPLLFCVACSPSLPPVAIHTAATAQLTSSPEAMVSQQQISAQKLLTDAVVYVAMGASDALGVGSDRPQAQGYVPLIASKLPRGSRTINLGINGIHLHQALKLELPQALNTQPQLITIWLVANDFATGTPDDDYMQDMRSLLKQLRTGTQARIVMANLPDLTQLPCYNSLSASDRAQMRQSTEKWNVRIGQIAAQYQVTIVDLYGSGSEITAHPQYISTDGFHPSAAGYSRLAHYFWSGISQDGT